MVRHSKDVTLRYKVGAQPAFFIVETGWPAHSRAPEARHASTPRQMEALLSGKAGSSEPGPMSIEDRLGVLFEQHLASQGLELDYLQVAGRGPRMVRVIVDRDGGVGVDQLAAVSRSLSRQLDRLDPFKGSYSLEVSSPGLERALHLPRHFRKSIGRDVTIKTHDEVAGSRHHRGVLEAADADGCAVRVDGESRLIGYEQMRSARTRFEWNKQSRATRKSG